MSLVPINVRGVVNMNQKHTSFRRIIATVVIVLLAGAIAGGVFWITQRNNDSQTGDSQTPGSPVALSSTPAFGSCEIVGEDDIRAIMQNGVVDIEQPERAGIVSPNTNIAEQCFYEFSTPLSGDNSITIEVFDVSADPNNTADILDASWSLDIDAELPSFYKLVENDDGAVTAYLRVIVGGQNIQWTFSQPVDAQQFTYSDLRYILLALSERADYGVIQATIIEENDIEPAPDSAN